MGKKHHAKPQERRLAQTPKKKQEPENIWDYVDETEPDEPARLTYKAQAPYLDRW